MHLRGTENRGFIPCAPYFLAVLLALLAAPRLRASEPEKARPWTVSAGLVSPSLAMSLYKEGRAHNITYKPNNPPRLSLGLWRRGVGGTLGFGSGKMKDDIDVETSYLDLQLFLTFSKIAVDLYWQSYEGYYSEDKATGTIEVHPDATMATQGLNVYHKLLGNVDLLALRAPHQEPRIFSFLLFAMASVSHRQFDTPIALVPASQWENYPDLGDLSQVNQSNASLSLGLIVPFHLGAFHFDPAMSIGMGLPFDHVRGRVGEQAGVKVNMKLRSGVGGPRGGVDFNIDADSDGMANRGGSTFQFHSLRIGLEGTRSF